MATAREAVRHAKEPAKRMCLFIIMSCRKNLPASAHGEGGGRHRVLDLGNRVVARVHHARDNRRIRLCLAEHRNEMLRASGAALSDDRHADRLGDEPRDRQLESGTRAVGIHRIDHDLARPQIDGALRPVHGV